MFKLNYNITKINFYLYLYNNEIYNDEKMEYLKKYCLIIKKLNLIYFLLYKYMNYYRKTVNKTANYVKLKMQIGALTVKISENNNKINDLLEVDKDIKKDIVNNSNSIKNMKNEISDKINKKYIDDTLYNKKYIDDNYLIKEDTYDKKYINDNFFTKRVLNNSFSSFYTRIDTKDDEVLKEIEDNYYNKNYIDILSNNIYNRTYLDNKFDDIYTKTEVNDKTSKLDRNIVLFNTNLTKFIDETYKENDNIIKEDIKNNKTKFDNFIINTFSTFSNNISNINNSPK